MSGGSGGGAGGSGGSGGGAGAVRRHHHHQQHHQKQAPPPSTASAAPPRHHHHQPAPRAAGSNNHNNKNNKNKHHHKASLRRDHHDDVQHFHRGTGTGRGRASHHSHNHNHHHHGPTTPAFSFAAAEFGFVLKPASPSAARPLAELSTEPDARAYWRDAACVVTFHEDPCPVCFDAPPRVATALPCGHVLCGLCHLRCISAGDEDGEYRCPVCLAPDALVGGVAFEGDTVPLPCVSFRARQVMGGPTPNSPIVFTLVREFPRDAPPPASDAAGASFCRFRAATRATLREFADRLRGDVRELRLDAARYRDTDAGVYVDSLEKKVDGIAKAWEALAFPVAVVRSVATPVTVTTTPVATTTTTTTSGSAPKAPVQWYQSFDGARDFLWGHNMRALVASFGEAALPAEISVARVLELEDVEDGRGVPKVLLPRGARARVAEIDVAAVPGVRLEALAPFADECRRRRQRRESRAASRAREAELQQRRARESAEARARARDEEEQMLARFFGFQDAQKAREKEAEAAAARSPVASTSMSTSTPPGSFRAVVSNMGYFPPLALGSGSSPSPAQAPSPSAAPVKLNAWGLPVAASASTTTSATTTADSPPNGMSLSVEDLIRMRQEHEELLASGGAAAAAAAKRGRGRRVILSNR